MLTDSLDRGKRDLLKNHAKLSFIDIGERQRYMETCQRDIERMQAHIEQMEDELTRLTK